jgi:ABC-type lipoprotein export system ATPase subunit
MSMDSQLLLADEPAGNLDEENSRNIIDILVGLAQVRLLCDYRDA